MEARIVVKENYRIPWRKRRCVNVSVVGVRLDTIRLGSNVVSGTRNSRLMQVTLLKVSGCHHLTERRLGNALSGEKDWPYTFCWPGPLGAKRYANNWSRVHGTREGCKSQDI